MNQDLTTSTQGEPVADRPLVRPAVDIFENQDELLIVADLPGVTADTLSIDLEEDRLTIFGRRPEIAGDDARVLMGGRCGYDYRRVFTIPDAVDAEKITAELDAGVLRLHLPRHERTRPRRIAIKAA